ncbi:lysophospholipid acyltransferase family protein [Pulveribacter suum]|uniref:Lipid A biosynthesis acyltransferase n=1 Tax=Pulveribacter suum TaxID=2116657 RepID=A0A2P1NPC4_9BURK|nr:hypothetical protein [Pulveribacter suum]AVP58846.1 hypothetical protein C7H73_14995 [Pulveribacter suum]
MGVRALWRRAGTEARDLVELVLLPGLAAVLPWRWCFAVFKRLAHWPWLYGAQCRQALEQARLHGCVGDDERAWLAERRLVTLLDHADHYLLRTRGADWLRRHVQVQGQWEATGQAALLWTFHWGMGMWALRHARAHGLRAPMVLAAPGGPDFVGRAVFGWYIRSRMRSVELALDEPVIFVPGGMAGVRSALEQGRQVVVVMDVPQDQVAVTCVTTLLGRPVSVPAVLPQLAARQGLPVTVFYMGVDLRTGRRILRIAPLGVHRDPQALADAAFAHLDHLLRTAPAAWHLWAQAPRFFVARD